MVKKDHKKNFGQSVGGVTFKNLRVGERISGWSRSAFSDTLFLVFLAGWLLPTLISLGYVWLNFNNLPLEIPLFYSRVWGESQLARNFYIFLPASGVLFLGIFDLGFAISFHFRDRVFAYLLAGTSSLLAVLALVTTLNIVNLVS